MLTTMTEEDWTLFDALAAMSETAHLVQMFDSTIVRAHVSAAGANFQQILINNAFKKDSIAG